MKRSKENRRYRRPILDPIRAKEKRRRRKGTYRVRRRAVTALCVVDAGALMRAAAVLCGRRATSLVLCARERRRKRKARMNAKGGNSALSLLFMDDLGRSWARDLLRTIS